MADALPSRCPECGRWPSERHDVGCKVGRQQIRDRVAARAQPRGPRWNCPKCGRWVPATPGTVWAIGVAVNPPYCPMGCGWMEAQP